MKRRKILATSNKFYTFIPMNFGMRQPPLIDSDQRIKERLQMVEELLHLEVASKLLKVRQLRANFCSLSHDATC
jgi:poly [ADP-ribose] polymerase